MMHAARIKAVAVFEFRQAVFRWSYLVVTLGLPILLGGAGGGAVLLQMYFLNEEAKTENDFGVVDDAGLFQHAARLVDGSITIDRYDTAALAKEALLSRKVYAFFLFPHDYRKTGQVMAYTRQDTSPLGTGLIAAERVLRDQVRRQLLRDRVPEDIIDRIVDPFDMEAVTVSRLGGIETPRDPTEWGTRLVLPILIAVLLSIALVSSTALLAQALTLEKQNRIVEMLVASISPEEILTGKLIGLGAAGLLQVLLWFSTTAGGALLATPFEAYAASLPWTALVAAPVFFLMGYLFVGSFMLATAALGTSAPENQKVGVVWAFLTMLPVMLLLVLAQKPDGWLAHAMTWFPFTSPVTVVLRLSISENGVAAWELTGSLAFLALCTWAAIRLGARLFRIGLLLTGHRLRWRDILRQAVTR